MNKQVNFKRSIPSGARAGVVGIRGPQAIAGQRMVRNSVCHMGTNGQMVCPGATNLRSRGWGGSSNPAPQLRYVQRYGGSQCTSNSGCQPGEVCVAGTCMGWIRAVPPRTRPFHPPLVGAHQRRLATPPSGPFVQPQTCFDPQGNTYWC